MLLGTGMVVATAAGLFPSLAEASAAMRQGGSSRRPNPGVREHFDRDCRIFLPMHEQRRQLDAMARGRAVE